MVLLAFVLFIVVSGGSRLKLMIRLLGKHADILYFQCLPTWRHATERRGRLARFGRGTSYSSSLIRFGVKCEELGVGVGSPSLLVAIIMMPSARRTSASCLTCTYIAQTGSTNIARPSQRRLATPKWRAIHQTQINIFSSVGLCQAVVVNHVWWWPRSRVVTTQ